MNSNTKKLVLTGALAAICLLFELTRIGYISFGNVIQITIFCVPVAVGTMILGLRSGLFLGFIFGLTSLFELLTRPDPITIILMSSDPMFWLKMPFIIFIPRLLIPVTTYFVFNAMSKNDKYKYLSLTVSSAVASLTNTVFFLGMLLVFFTNMPIINFGLVGTVVLTNSIPELILIVITCPPIVKALKLIHI